MKPIKTADTNVDLPALEGAEAMSIGQNPDGTVFSVWEVSPDELDALGAGARIRLTSRQPIEAGMEVDAVEVEMTTGATLATGLDRMVVTLNFDPPHGHNWDVRDDTANPGDWSHDNVDRWYRAELRVNARTGERRITGLPFLTPPPVNAPAKANPVQDAEPGRVDQGTDYNLRKGGVAPYKCKVLRAVPYTAGWRGGWLVCEILEGPFAGQGFYAAEGVKNFPKVGAVVPAGGHLCDPDKSGWGQPFGNCEWGWVADDANRPLAQQLGSQSDHDVQAITCGLAFDHFVRGLGGPGCTNFSGVEPDWAILPAKLRAALKL